MRNRRTIVRLVVAALFFSALLPAAARAQQPVCPQLPATAQAIVACRPAYGFSLARLIWDFSVDHLLKPAPWSFERTAISFTQQLAFAELKENAPLVAFLTSIPAVKLSQLDRTTGTLLGVFDTAERTYEAPLAKVLGDPKIRIELPERLEGGYWRGPEVVQMAFWEGKRVRIRVEAADGNHVEGEIACISATPEGITISFAGADTPPLVILVRGCTA